MCPISQWQRDLNDPGSELAQREAERARARQLQLPPHPVPYSVHAAAAPAPVIVCAHDEITVHRSIGSTFDDHETTYGQCRACGAWVVSTLMLMGGHLETRPMTALERSRFAAAADREQRSEWLDDWQAGGR